MTMSLSSPHPSSSSVVLLLSVDAGLRRRSLTSSAGSLMAGMDGPGEAIRSSRAGLLKHA